jgi:GTP-binding protein
MSESNFIDQVKIYIRSGKGGRGSTHFRREKYVPFGGPDGGDGGNGGNVIIRGNRNYWTLLHLKYERHVLAEHGQNGSGRLSHGKDGADKIIEAPLGTIVFDADTGEFLADVQHDQQEIVLLRGGRGGRGNDHFKTATHQAPRYAQPGEPFLEQHIVLQLKLLADVGLVGFPNAGKSTLLSALSSAKPKIADYPFTTLQPNLGIIDVRNQHTFVMADIPGIIEGASQGKGLGLRFLRHIERNSMLLFLVPADASDIVQQYQILLHELTQYNPQLLNKQRLLVISKSDLLDDELETAISRELPTELPHIFLSAVTGRNLIALKDLLWQELNRLPYSDDDELIYKPLEIQNVDDEPDDAFLEPIE